MPVTAIFENIEAGASINDLMEWFDGLDREQVKAVIEFAARSLDAPPTMQQPGQLADAHKIHNPEFVQRVNAHIETGHFHDADEVIETALDALEERAQASISPAEARTGQDLIVVGTSVRGLLTDEEVDTIYNRNKSGARSVNFDEARFRAAVREGIAQADGGEFIEEEEMDARLEQMLRS
jgi:Arc/MetJ-type ribon-helix-helix transcriptional regulator